MSQFVLILSPFKCGSMSLEQSLINHGIACHRSHGYWDGDIQPSHVILIDREDKTRLWLSGYFQDVDSPQYPFCYSSDREVILNADPVELWNHFKGFPWETFEQYRIDCRIDELRDRFGIEIPKDQYGIYENEKISVFYASLESLNDERDHLAHFLGLSEFKLGKTHVGLEQWYAPQYKALLEFIQ